MKAFFLGLSSGAACVAYCAPVLVPILLGGGEGVARSAGVMLKFHAGRLAGYLIFGVPVRGPLWELERVENVSGRE